MNNILACVVYKMSYAIGWAEIPEVPEDILSNGRRYN